MAKNPKNSESPEEESRRILERVAQDSETVGTSSMRRVAERVKDHATAQDKEGDSWAEIWGTRIGRTLGMIFFVFLVLYLMKTYVFDG